jgi:hypothetical protein
LFIVPIHRSSFVHSPYSSFVQIIFVQPLSYQNSDRSFIRSFVRSFIVPIHRSFIVTIHHSSFVHMTIHNHYSPLVFIIVTIYRYYSLTLFIVTISIITFCRHYSSLLFIDHPLTPNFNYSSIMLSSPLKTSQTNIPVIQTSVTVIFLPVGSSHLVTHPRFLQVKHA